MFVRNLEVLEGRRLTPANPRLKPSQPILPAETQPFATDLTTTEEGQQLQVNTLRTSDNSL